MMDIREYPRICRFCKQGFHQDNLIKYALRHWACVPCYFNSGKNPAELGTWKIKELLKYDKETLINSGHSTAVAHLARILRERE